MSYQGPAVIVSGGHEIPAQVQLTTMGERWEGFGEPVELGHPDISPDAVAVIRLPDGREGQAHVAVHDGDDRREASLEIAGAGPAPFDD